MLNKLSEDFKLVNVNFNSQTNNNYSIDDRRREQNYDGYNDTQW